LRTDKQTPVKPQSKQIGMNVSIIQIQNRSSGLDDALNLLDASTTRKNIFQNTQSLKYKQRRRLNLIRKHEIHQTCLVLKPCGSHDSPYQQTGSNGTGSRYLLKQLHIMSQLFEKHSSRRSRRSTTNNPDS
jgi:hypothetical protein